MCGDRDSEFCLLVNDPSKQHGGDLRLKIWAAYLGLDPNDDVVQHLDPKSERCYRWWCDRAEKNLKIHQKLLPFAPVDQAYDYKSMETYRDQFKELQPSEMDDIVKDIKGCLISFPLKYLEGEDLSQAAMPVCKEK